MSRKYEFKQPVQCKRGFPCPACLRCFPPPAHLTSGLMINRLLRSFKTNWVDSNQVRWSWELSQTYRTRETWDIRPSCAALCLGQTALRKQRKLSISHVAARVVWQRMNRLIAMKFLNFSTFSDVPWRRFSETKLLPNCHFSLEILKFCVLLNPEKKRNSWNNLTLFTVWSWTMQILQGQKNA